MVAAVTVRVALQRVACVAAENGGYAVPINRGTGSDARAGRIRRGDALEAADVGDHLVVEMILQNTGRRLDVAGEAVQRVVRNGVGIAPHLPRASCFPLVPAGDVDERGVYRKGVLPLFGKIQPVRDGVLAAVGTVGVGIAASEYVIPCVHGSQSLAGRPVLRYRDAHLLHRVGSLAHHLCLRVDGDPFPCRIVAMPVVGHKLDAVTALVRQDEVILGGVAGIDHAEGEEFLRIGALFGTELRGIGRAGAACLPSGTTDPHTAPWHRFCHTAQ